MGGDSLLEQRERYELLSVTTLRKMVEDADLPVPICWVHLPVRCWVAKGASLIKCKPVPSKGEEEKGKGKGRAKVVVEEEDERQTRSLSELLAPGDVLRVGVNDEDMEAVRRLWLSVRDGGA